MIITTALQDFESTAMRLTLETAAENQVLPIITSSMMSAFQQIVESIMTPIWPFI